MRLGRDAVGKERLWYDDQEFEQITEDALRTCNLYPKREYPVVDIERLIEKQAGVRLDQHVPLPENIAGKIAFTSEGILISINRELTEAAEQECCQPGVRGRWRATLAHECGHLLLHRPLFEGLESQSVLRFLEDVDIDSGSITCYRSDIEGSGNRDWKEYQANRAMGALLMPRRLFIADARCELQLKCLYTIPPEGEYEHTQIVRSLAQKYEVSKQAAAIRLALLEPALGSTKSLGI